ncbi:hypothetical protein [Mycolicibacterium sediminis]|nr:hypothetical protein [Mycolicibacterium sediminis]
MGGFWTVAAVGVVVLASGCGEPADPPSAAPSPSPPTFANPAEYASPDSRYPQWGFLTPSSTWVCVIADYPSNGNRAACALNPDEGPLRFQNMPPAQAPDPGGDPSRPNVIAVMESADAGFLSLGRPIWESAGTPRTLPAGTVLQTGGFTCKTQVSVVSCRDDQTGKGFTVSPNGFGLTYIDLP